MAEPGEFSLIIENVDKEQLSDAAVQFAAAFSLDATLSQQICKSAPIIFAQKLTKAEVKAVTPRLKELSGAGLEFRVTARTTGKIPKVNWPVRPHFTAGDSAGPHGLAFEWENSAFVCPSCGETYLFRRLGKLELAEPAPASSAAPPVETVETLREDLMTFNEAPEPGPDIPPAPEPVAAEPANEEIDLQADPIPDAPLEPDLQPVEEPLAEPLPDVAPEPLDELASDPVGDAPLPMEETSIDEPAGEFTAAADEAQAAPPAPAPAPAPEPEPEEEDDGGEKYNVFLSKITDSAKRKKAIDLIAKVKGCNESDAKELTTRLVIPLAKNVSKKKAESILQSFKKLKIFGRMTKVK